jgi:Fe-S-cluster containining protein
MASESFDCQTCGACCVNPLENEREGFRSWVEVRADEPLHRRKDLVRKLVVLDDDGLTHLKLDGEGRCVALKGALGRRVSCAIYALRPKPCRRVQAGDKDCLRYRRERGIA